MFLRGSTTDQFGSERKNIETLRRAISGDGRGEWLVLITGMATVEYSAHHRSCQSSYEGQGTVSPLECRTGGAPSGWPPSMPVGPAGALPGIGVPCYQTPSWEGGGEECQRSREGFTGWHGYKQSLKM